jgi:hypothetical protein
VYNQFVAEAPLVRQRGRLRFAQEQKLRRLGAETGVSIETPEGYLSLFEGAPQVPLASGPLTRAAFLGDPIRLWYSDRRGDIDPEWFQEAWHTRPAFRDRLTFELTESVQLHGNFRKAAKLLKYLPTVLHRDDVVALYKTIEYESGRLADEWRPRFERAFAEHADALPPRPVECPYCGSSVKDPSNPCSKCGRFHPDTTAA